VQHPFSGGVSIPHPARPRRPEMRSTALGDNRKLTGPQTTLGQSGLSSNIFPARNRPAIRFHRTQ